jgi:hypothetical protein
MGASEWGKPPNSLRAKGVEKEEEEEEDQVPKLWKSERGSNGMMKKTE